LLFSKTVVLSLGKSPNRRCWDEYCKDGGVRYEFEYDESHFTASEVNCGDVVYDDNKTFNLPQYLIEHEPVARIQKLLQAESGLGWSDWACLLLWLKTKRPNQITLQHVTQELVFKKIRLFNYEDEYRFVHLLSQIGPKPLKLSLLEQKTSYEKIGLKLVKISTSSVEQVTKELAGKKIEVAEVYFS
jgi:hypothetical protein